MGNFMVINVVFISMESYLKRAVYILSAFISIGLWVLSEFLILSILFGPLMITQNILIGALSEVFMIVLVYVFGGEKAITIICAIVLPFIGPLFYIMMGNYIAKDYLQTDKGFIDCVKDNIVY